eukprot:CAMPEP_0169100302 /NCGR_PEP_ID=MMETSP1015-20121227/21013_1 /TAXON_ID=342587 /ORGANISM="Karlodinium micrum, Strain CCMP2283" /LENGTH=469 /DNA_ID=CAMNT_0009161231 /DNA_START=53 /DNA_END=1462 /DNA_ORIENTATION=+
MINKELDQLASSRHRAMTDTSQCHRPSVASIDSTDFGLSEAQITKLSSPNVEANSSEAERNRQQLLEVARSLAARMEEATVDGSSNGASIAEKTLSRNDGFKVELQWMFADSILSKSDPLGLFGSKPFLPDALAENIGNHTRRPVLIRAAQRGNRLEKTFATPEEAMHWLRTDGVLPTTEAPSMLEVATTRTRAIIKDPNFQTVCISTCVGAIALGSVGGAFGCASGILLGGAAGVVPALITFGLSIPACASLCGGTGLCSGAVLLGSTGAIGAGVMSHTGYKYRVLIKDGFIFIRKRAGSITGAKDTHISICGVIDGTKIKVKTLSLRSQEEASKLVTFTKRKFVEAMEKPVALVHEPKVQVTTAGLALGTIAGGAVGGGTGVLVGAAAGFVPAIFTFGLSIPVSAAVVGGVGLFAGSSVGAVGGGLAGFAGYTYRKQLKASKETTCEFVGGRIKSWSKRLSSSGGTS